MLSSPSILVLAAAGLLLAHVFVVLYEEPVLSRTFGESHDRYRRSVHRWIVRAPR